MFEIVIASYQRWSKPGLISKEFRLLKSEYPIEELRNISENSIRRSSNDEVIVKITEDDYAYIDWKNNVLIPFMDEEEAEDCWDNINLYAK